MPVYCVYYKECKEEIKSESVYNFLRIYWLSLTNVDMNLYFKYAW